MSLRPVITSTAGIVGVRRTPVPARGNRHVTAPPGRPGSSCEVGADPFSPAADGAPVTLGLRAYERPAFRARRLGRSRRCAEGWHCHGGHAAETDTRGRRSAPGATAPRTHGVGGVRPL